jgi:hypothetical protein
MPKGNPHPTRNRGKHAWRTPGPGPRPPEQLIGVPKKKVSGHRPKVVDTDSAL